MSPWQNNVVLVTGGSSGIGRIIADAFADAGAKLVIVGLEADAVQRAADEMRAANADVLGLHADITRQEDVDRLFAEAIGRFGRLDVLVNNAGRSMRGKVLDTTPDQFRDLMELNLIALVRCTRAAVPHLLAQRGSRGQHRVSGSQVGRPLGGGVSGPRSLPWRPIRSSCGSNLAHRGCTCCWCAPVQSNVRTPGCIRWPGWKTCPRAPGLPAPGCRSMPFRRKSLPAPILRACERRQPELVIPGKARLLFALSQLWPSLGDWIVRRKSG